MAAHTAVTTVATCLYPENTFAVPFTITKPTFWPLVTLENGVVSRVEGNFGVGAKSLASSLPTNTWYWSTPARALGFLINSADLGFRAIRPVKAVFDGARMVMFWAVESV